jgi:hypothetical protein
MTAVRAIVPDDMPLIQGWAEQRGLTLEGALLSPHGFLVEHCGTPSLVAWCYMLLDVPVIQIDHLTSRPGLTIGQLRETWAALLVFVKTWIRLINENSGLHYNVLRCFCERRMLGEAAKDGWQITSREYYQIVKTLT